MGKFIAWFAILVGLFVLSAAAQELAERPQRLAEMAKMKAEFDAVPSAPSKRLNIMFQDMYRSMHRQTKRWLDDYPRTSLLRMIGRFAGGTLILAFGLWSLQVHRHLPKRPKANRVW